MFSSIRNAHPRQLLYLLACMSGFAFLLSVVRVIWSLQTDYLFLNWNLFLAFIPWYLSSYISVHPELRKKKRHLLLLLCIWFGFFPNAPYILTDLFHLRTRMAVPIWYDLIMILTFAWTGLSFWFISLMQIESLLLKFFKQRLVSMLIVLITFATAFGVYIGRFLRWNTWDVILNPFSLAVDIMVRFAVPWHHTKTWAVTIMMGTLLFFIYQTIKLVTSDKVTKEPKDRF